MRYFLAVLALLMFAGVALAGETALTFEGGNMWLLDYGDTPTLLPGLGAGISYRPTYVNEEGQEVPSDLLFLLGITPTPDQPYGSLMVDWRLATWQGIKFYLGPGVATLYEEGGNYSLGAVGEARMEFGVANNPMFFVIGSGYIWRQATEALPDPANVPFYLALGARTQ